jgi:hypothetical protein
MKQDTTSYITELQAELRRLGCDREQTGDVMAEVFEAYTRRPDGDLAVVFGPPAQYAHDATTGRRPPRIRYLQRLGAALSALDVPPARVGEVLAEVDEHVRDSGQDPVEAFGRPEEYARQVADVAGPAVPAATRPVPQALLSVALATAGTLLSVEGLVALLRGGPAPLTAAVLVAVVVVPVLEVGAGVLVRRPAPLGILAALVSTVGLWLVQAAVLVRFRTPVVTELPAAAHLVAGLVLVAAAVWGARSLTGAALPEPVLDPRPRADDHPVFETVEAREALVRRTVRWAVVPVLAEILSLVVVVLLLR